jgi:uncharacterized membrane protein YkvA (DUF1232 family)
MVYVADPAGSGSLKPAVTSMVIYVLSPVDLLPKTTPLAGVVDNLALVPVAGSFLAKRLPSAARADSLRRAS